jgi:hypothetical protein
MTRAQLGAIAKRVARHLPSYACRGPLLFVSPVSHTLRGVLLDRSGDPRAFYVTAFLQPLCFPVEHLVLNAGWRLGGGTHRWTSDSVTLEHDLVESIRRSASPVLLPAETPLDVAKALTAMGKSKDAVVVEMVACSFARANEPDRALTALDQLLNLVVGDARPFVRESFDRAQRLKELLLAQSPEVQTLLSEWEDQTAAMLGLERFRTGAGVQSISRNARHPIT